MIKMLNIEYFFLGLFFLLNFRVNSKIKCMNSSSSMTIVDQNAKLNLIASPLGQFKGKFFFRDNVSSCVTASTTEGILFLYDGITSGALSVLNGIQTLGGQVALNTNTYTDTTVIQLSKDLTINSGDTAWAFSGNAEIDGNGATLTINKSQGITITGAKTLTLKNVRLVTSVSDAIKCLSSSATISLQNAEWYLADDFDFSAGSCTFSGTVKITGNANLSNRYSTFKISTSGSVTVNNDGELIFARDTRCLYSADPTGAANFAATKRKFSMATIGARLTFIGSTLETTNTGLAFDQGNLSFYDRSSVRGTSATGAQFEIADQVNLIVNGKLDVRVPFYYTEGLGVLYGDSIALKHVNYGGYLGGFNNTTATIDGTRAFMRAALTNDTRFYIQRWDSNTRWAPVDYLEKPVKSGDPIRLESRSTFTNLSTTRKFLQVGTSNDTGGAPYGALVSSAPAKDLYLNSNRYNYDNGVCLFRIYKKGGFVGDPIMKNDLIYLVYYLPNYNTSPYACSGNQYYYYVGSANLTYSSFEKETFAYEVTTATQPSNMTTNLLWQVAEVTNWAYRFETSTDIYTDVPLQLSNYAPKYPLPAYFSAILNAWPSAALIQF